MTFKARREREMTRKGKKRRGLANKKDKRRTGTATELPKTSMDCTLRMSLFFWNIFVCWDILLYDFTRFPKHDFRDWRRLGSLFSRSFYLPPICSSLLSPDRSSNPWRDQTSLVDITLFLGCLCLRFLLVCVLRIRDAIFFCLLLGFSRTLDRKRHSFNGREAVLYLLLDLLYQYWWWDPHVEYFILLAL